MKTKILLFLITLLFAVTKVNAQAHNMRTGWCKYAKKAKGQAKDESESAVCQVCRKENEKEKIARAAEDKRRNDVAVAKGKADKAANVLAYKKMQQEIAEKNKVTEVFVTMPKSSVVKKDESDRSEIGNYKIINEFKSLRDMSEFSTYNSKISYKDKIIFESNDFIYIKAAGDKLLFIADYPRKDGSCTSSEANNSILLDKKGKKINLPGIDKFGYYTNDKDRDDYFVIVVYTGTCTPVANDKYAKGDWHTIKYTFDYKTRSLIGTKPSWQHSSCPCN
nr:hypothetical protein [uncultured Flavobacterium sp.]